MRNFNFFLEAPTSTIQESIPRTEKELLLYGKIACSISGGSDSDTMLDFICRIGFLEKVQFYFFDTGIEMEATKKHLSFLEQKYKIKINRIKPSKGVAYTVKKYGYPFLSKQVSEYIGRLQRHGFQWEDEPLDRLLQKYPKCKVALRWWCNGWGENSKFNIDSTPYLKEFLMQNPPKFLISPICCKYSKKDPAENFAKKITLNLLLLVLGRPRVESGVPHTKHVFLTAHMVGNTSLFFGGRVMTKPFMMRNTMLCIAMPILCMDANELVALVVHLGQILKVR